MKKLILIGIFILSNLFIQAQKRTISGIVKDTAGGLPGAFVMVKGTKTVTRTDYDGKFSLVVNSKDSILIFSYIGFKTQEVSVKNKTHFSILMVEGKGSFDELFLPTPRRYISFTAFYVKSVNYLDNGVQVDLPFSPRLGITTSFRKGYNQNQSYSFSIYRGFYSSSIKKAFSLNFTYENIDINDLSFHFEKYRIEISTYDITIFPMKSTRLNIGIGYANIDHFNQPKSLVGYTFGVKQNLFDRFYIHYEGSIWKNLWQHQTGIEWSYKKFNLFYNYQRIQPFKEHSFGIGYRFLF